MICQQKNEKRPCLYGMTRRRKRKRGQASDEKKQNHGGGRDSDKGQGQLKKQKGFTPWNGGIIKGVGPRSTSIQASKLHQSLPHEKTGDPSASRTWNYKGVRKGPQKRYEFGGFLKRGKVRGPDWLK